MSIVRYNITRVSMMARALATLIVSRRGVRKVAGQVAWTVSQKKDASSFDVEVRFYKFLIRIFFYFDEIDECTRKEIFFTSFLYKGIMSNLK